MGDPAIFTRIDSFERDGRGLAEVIQIEEDKKSFRAKEHNGDETKKGIRVGDGIKGKPYHEGRSQIISKKDVGLPSWVCIKSIGPSG